MMDTKEMMDIEEQAYNKNKEFISFTFGVMTATFSVGVALVEFAAVEYLQLLITLSFALFTLRAFDHKHELKRLAKKATLFQNPIKSHFTTPNAIVYPVFFGMLTYQIHLILL